MAETVAQGSADLRSDDEAWWTYKRRNYVLFLLCLVGVVNFIDRQILAILLQPIQDDLQVSDTMMGLLSGIAFSAFYVVAGIPLARLVDRGSRRKVLVGCLSVWSAATVLCGFVQSFAQLALARVGVASGEAGGGPATQSLLADLFPLSKRATVIGIWLGSQSIGIAFGLFFGGWLNTAFDWRTAFIVVGLPGLVLAAIVAFTMKDPPRGMSDTDAEKAHSVEIPPLRESLALIFRSPPLRLLIIIAMACSFAGYSILGWGPTFYIRVHGLTTMEVGTWMGLAIATGLFLGNVSAGRIADYVSKGNLATYMKVAGIGTLLAAPAGLVFLHADSVTVSLFGLFASKLFMTFWMPPTYAVAIGLSSPRNRGMITAMLTLSTTLVGIGFGPVFVGAMNDVLAPTFGEDAIRYSLTIVLAGLVLCAILCFVAIRPVRRALEERKAQMARPPRT